MFYGNTTPPRTGDLKYTLLHNIAWTSIL